jgi:hypothetical protein
MRFRNIRGFKNNQKVEQFYAAIYRIDEFASVN